MTEHTADLRREGLRELVSLLPLIDYCAEECRRQRSGELSVSWMLQAWAHALDHEGPITVELILRLGAIVEPDKNANGFRRVPVRVGWDIMPDADLVPAMIDRLVEFGPGAVGSGSALGDSGPWYEQYERIHPFRDGNGRTGKVLYNLMRGTLLAPEFPPDYFGGGIP